MAVLVFNLPRDLGPGKKIAFGSVSAKDGDTINTGLSSIDAVALTSSDATHIAAAASISGGTITLGLKDNSGSAVSSAETVYVIAIGD